MQPNPVPGIHHVTAIAGDPERNLAFYTGVLGLRFVKRTVNHDDPETYHFYYGDGKGTPGTTITFFPWTARGRSGAFGAGQTEATAYLTDTDGLDFWADRLDREGIEYERTERFGDPLLRFDDPDSVALKIVASKDVASAPANPWEESPVPAERQLRGFHGVTLAVADREPTGRVLERLGYEERDSECDRGSDGERTRHRYRTPAGEAGAIVDLVETDRSRGRMGVGTVHHVRSRPQTKLKSAPGARRCRNSRSESPTSSTGSTSVRSTSGNRAACSSKSRRSVQGSRRTNRSTDWERGWRFRNGSKPTASVSRRTSPTPTSKGTSRRPEAHYRPRRIRSCRVEAKGIEWRRIGEERVGAGRGGSRGTDRGAEV